MKFLDHLKAVETGNRQIILESLYAIRYDVTPTDTDYAPRFAKEFSITVRLGASQYIEEDLIKASDGKVVEYAVEDMKHAIAENLYGQLRKDLQELHFQIRNEFGYRDTKSNDMLVKIIEKISL